MDTKLAREQGRVCQPEPQGHVSKSPDNLGAATSVGRHRTPYPRGRGYRCSPTRHSSPGTGLGQRVWARLHLGPGLTAPRPTPPWVRTAGEWAASLRPGLG
ncbi:unnamed protein product [Rangifer tarandus platyrhynchus]|uniref:Uncharacterized protein n=2 Tax=Rangifer tarandus platyrhynchus TaxID=3082113 RepID=A0AC60A9U5_RANTA|nr:unnamed protein product [Rangifer tarandus platyrhynchus]